MKSNCMVAEPLRHISNMVQIVIVQMLAGGHDFEIAQARCQYLVQNMGIEPLLGKHGSTETVVHQYPTAFPSARGSAAPNFQPERGSTSIASQSPILSLKSI